MEEPERLEQLEQLEQLLTVQQLADLLRVRRSWIYNKRHNHTLPFPTIKVGFPSAAMA